MPVFGLDIPEHVLKSFGDVFTVVNGVGHTGCGDLTFNVQSVTERTRMHIIPFGNESLFFVDPLTGQAMVVVIGHLIFIPFVPIVKVGVLVFDRIGFWLQHYSAGGRPKIVFVIVF